MLETWNAPEELRAVVLDHENLNRDELGPAGYADLILVANLLSHVDAFDCNAESPMWTLPAILKLGVDASTAAELTTRAAERAAELNLNVGDA